MATPPPDDWPFKMQLHMLQTKPTPEPLPCPKCDDEMEPIWEQEEGELPPPVVCPTCLLLIEEQSI
jgi:hypothetical protein